MNFLSGYFIILLITWEVRIVLQNIRRRFVGNILINISLSIIFPNLDEICQIFGSYRLISLLPQVPDHL